MKTVNLLKSIKSNIILNKNKMVDLFITHKLIFIMYFSLNYKLDFWINSIRGITIKINTILSISGSNYLSNNFCTNKEEKQIKSICVNI